MKKYVVLGVFSLVLAKILATPVFELNFSKTCPIVQTSDTISQKEADLFLTQWGEYVKRGYMAKVPEDLNFDYKDASDRIPWIVKLWFDKNCINPQRFYYVEQRLRTILKAYELKKHTQRVIEVLSSQIKPGMDLAQKQWYQSLIKEQKEMSKVEGISEEEFLIVKDRDVAIRELLR